MILKRNEEHLGIVGEKTNYRTIHGEDIHVGDLVKLKIFGGEFTVIEPMVKGNTTHKQMKAFVMGVEMSCNDVEGTVEGSKILEIVKPYTALEIGDELGSCVVVAENKERRKEVPAEENLGAKLFFEVIDKAIVDLKDSGKDYYGLEFFKKILFEGGIK